MASTTGTWSDAFRAHLARRGLTQMEAVFDLRRAKIHASYSTVHYWCHGALPREATRAKIERWSGGEVPASADGGSGRLPSTGTD